MRRLFLAFMLVAPLSVGRAEAVTVRDIIELTKAGVSEQVLLALIEVDRNVFTLDAATMKALKEGGVSDTVVLAMIRSGRTPMTAPESAAEPAVQPQQTAASAADPEPRVIVIDHHDSQPAQQPSVLMPVATVFPGFGVPTAGFGVPAATLGVPITGFGVNTFGFRTNGIIRNVVVPTQDGGAVKVNLPVPQNCVKASPVYWGFGGKLRPGSWAPPPQILCQ